MHFFLYLGMMIDILTLPHAVRWLAWYGQLLVYYQTGKQCYFTAPFNNCNCYCMHMHGLLLAPAVNCASEELFVKFTCKTWDMCRWTSIVNYASSIWWTMLRTFLALPSCRKFFFQFFQVACKENNGLWERQVHWSTHWFGLGMHIVHVQYLVPQAPVYILYAVLVFIKHCIIDSQPS